MALQPAGEARAQLEFSDPLEVPADPLPTPELVAEADAGARIEQAADVWRQHGYTDLPILAWALLDGARESGVSADIDRAVALAPNSPGVRFEAARLKASPEELMAAMATLATSFPGLLWLAQLLGTTIIVAMAGGAALLCGFAILRSLPLHAHALGHLGNSKDAVAGPCVVAAVGTLGLLPVVGVGPALLVGAVGGLAAMRLPRREAIWITIALTLAGVSLGPGLDYVSRVVAIQGRDSALLAAWRVDRSQPLPGDRLRLEAAVERDPGESFWRVALATSWKRLGDLDRAEEVLTRPRTNEAPELIAAVFNLRGIIHLARGSAKRGIREFEDARAAHESAPVLFNLSQGYGRALRLLDQEPVFNAARELDRDLVSRYAEHDGSNVHRHLIQGPLPLKLFARHALEADTASALLAREFRDRTLGARPPSFIWVLLPLIGLLAIWGRQSNIGHCRRCSRAICSDCAPNVEKTATCVRCEALLGRSLSDPRVHSEQLRIERRRRARIHRLKAASSLLLPGSTQVHEGHLPSGWLQLAAVMAGFYLVGVAPTLPAPWDIGALASALPLLLGFALLVPLYVRGGLRALNLLRETGMRG